MQFYKNRQINITPKRVKGSTKKNKLIKNNKFKNVKNEKDIRVIDILKERKLKHFHQRSAIPCHSVNKQSLKYENNNFKHKKFDNYDSKSKIVKKNSKSINTIIERTNESIDWDFNDNMVEEEPVQPTEFKEHLPQRKLKNLYLAYGKQVYNEAKKYTTRIRNLNPNWTT